MRIVFMGTPQFAVPSLRSLAATFHVVGVVTRPDRPTGRGRSIHAPPVREAAEDLGLACIQPARVSRPESLKALHGWDPEVIVVAAFGEILSREVLDLPPLGCLNVHASLLPRWRGASPIQSAILHGDSETGVTLMRMEQGLDTGPVVAQTRTPVGRAETAGELEARLAQLGAELLLKVLPLYASGEVIPQPQPDTGVTSAPRLRKDSGRLDFVLPAEQLERQVRAFEPWPTSFFEWQDKRIVVRRATAVAGSGSGVGRVVAYDGRPAVTTGEGWLVLERVQAAGGRPMSGEEFLRGARNLLGADLTAGLPRPTNSSAPSR